MEALHSNIQIGDIGITKIITIIIVFDIDIFEREILFGIIRIRIVAIIVGRVFAAQFLVISVTTQIFAAVTSPFCIVGLFFFTFSAMVFRFSVHSRVCMASVI